MFVLAFVMMIAMAVSAMIALHNEAQQARSLSHDKSLPFAVRRIETDRF